MLGFEVFFFVGILGGCVGGCWWVDVCGAGLCAYLCV